MIRNSDEVEEAEHDRRRKHRARGRVVPAQRRGAARRGTPVPRRCPAGSSSSGGSARPGGRSGIRYWLKLLSISGGTGTKNCERRNIPMPEMSAAGTPMSTASHADGWRHPQREHLPRVEAEAPHEEQRPSQRRSTTRFTTSWPRMSKSGPRFSVIDQDAGPTSPQTTRRPVPGATPSRPAAAPVSPAAGTMRRSVESTRAATRMQPRGDRGVDEPGHWQHGPVDPPDEHLLHARRWCSRSGTNTIAERSAISGRNAARAGTAAPSMSGRKYSWASRYERA